MTHTVDDAQLDFDLDLYPDNPEPDERWIKTPREHGQLLHVGGMGTVTIAQKFTDDRWRERAYPVEVALDFLNQHYGRPDVYLSMQRFRGRRRIAHLLSMGALHADLDYYNVPDLASVDPRRVLARAIETLKRANKPEPTLAISSGQGLYLLWLHDPIPRSALPRWNACQHELQCVLAPLGADAMAVDAARVLRVVGTYHGGTGSVVEAITPTGDVWTFNHLADRLLPLTRVELHDLRVQRALRHARSTSERHHTPPEGFTQATLWEARLSDLQRLREVRGSGQPLPDFRDRWLFVAGVAMSWLALPIVLQRELHALAHEVGGWTEAKTRSKLHAIFRTAHEAAAGRKVEWEGLKIDPRYRLKNQTIIEWLEITAEEEREMRTLISGDERRRRDKEEKRQERRDAGAMTREEYEGRAQVRRLEAHRMAAEGLRTQEIARTLGVSIHSVRSYLYRDV